eukprot:2807811-Prymnesium_polylepis.1
MAIPIGAQRLCTHRDRARLGTPAGGGRGGGRVGRGLVQRHVGVAHLRRHPLAIGYDAVVCACLLYTSPSPRDAHES